MVIQWYPGHMAKAKREAIENRKMVDLIIELVDARLPESSRNPMVAEIAGNKPRLIIMNKADLADKKTTENWVKFFKENEEGQRAIAVNVFNQADIQFVKKTLKDMMQDQIDAQIEKGMNPRAIRLMVLGIPNVGKSTFINQMIQKNKAKTANRPGVTQQQQWLKIGSDFELLDTPGILWPKFEDQEVGIKLALTGAIKDTLFHKDDVALYALRFFLTNYPNRIKERYHVEEENRLDELPDLLMDLTKKMNFGEDYDRASERLIFEIRDGKLGPYTLDKVPQSPLSSEMEQI